MGGAVFPPCCLTWGQTMVEIMKIMATSFKRSHVCTAALSAPDPTTGHRWPTPLPETPGYSRASLGQSPVSPWNSPGQNTGVDSLSLLQGIFPIQGSNPGLLHCGQILYQLSYQGSPREDTREDSTHGHHQMVNTEIRLIIFFAAVEQKQDWELTVTQIMNSLLPNSDLNWRK